MAAEEGLVETAVGRAGAAHTAAAWQARTGERRAAGVGEAAGLAEKST